MKKKHKKNWRSIEKAICSSNLYFCFFCIVESASFCRESKYTYKKSHRRCSVKKAALKNFAKFTEKHFSFSITCLFFNKVAVAFFIKLMLINIEAVVQTCSVKKVFLKILLNSQENTCARLSFLRTPAQVLFCEICKVFKNTFFTEHVWKTVSILIQTCKANTKRGYKWIPHGNESL